MSDKHGSYDLMNAYKFCYQCQDYTNFKACDIQTSNRFELHPSIRRFMSCENCGVEKRFDLDIESINEMILKQKHAACIWKVISNEDLCEASCGLAWTLGEDLTFKSINYCPKCGRNVKVWIRCEGNYDGRCTDGKYLQDMEDKELQRFLDDKFECSGCREAISDETEHSHKAPCFWNEVIDGMDISWKTSCGNRMIFEEGTPYDNQITYCMICGRKVQIIEKANI